MLTTGLIPVSRDTLATRRAMGLHPIGTACYLGVTVTVSTAPTPEVPPTIDSSKPTLVPWLVLLNG